MSETTITKTCTKCKQIKPSSEFYKKRNNCKSCALKQVKKYTQSEKGKITQKHYQQSKKGKIANKVRQKRFYIRHPEYCKAKNAIKYAIATGKLPRPDTLQCSYCPAIAEEYHHHKGYAPEYWLDVIPVCISCHHN